MDGDGNEKDYNYSVYVNTNKERRENKKDLDLEVLEEIIAALKPVGPRRITKTWCGYIASFVNEQDADELLNTSLEDALGPSVKVAKFSTKDIRNKQTISAMLHIPTINRSGGLLQCQNVYFQYLQQYDFIERINCVLADFPKGKSAIEVVLMTRFLKNFFNVLRSYPRDDKNEVLLLRDVPGAVPLQEVKICLEKQGIFPVKIERQRQNVKIEVADGTNYEALLRNGLDFFGITRFSAVPERWRRPTLEMPQDNVIQCYRCQNFWHIAAHCTLPPRCVRCGGPHSVEICARPRNDPFCCHCGGPHHAAYRHCPMRLQITSSPLAYPISVRGCSR